jgi:hypothetical protein
MSTDRVDIPDGIRASPAIIAGCFFLVTDVVTGLCFEDMQQGSAVAVNPSCDVESGLNFTAVAAAFKTDVTKGTAPPAAGIHIDHQYTFVLYTTMETSRTIQIPADGNLLAYSATPGVGDTYTTADSHQNSYTDNSQQYNTVHFVYAANASADVSQAIRISTTGNTEGEEFVVYDIRGAKTTSPIGCQSPVSGIVSQSVFTAGTTISNIPTIIPCAANDLMIWAMQNGCGPPQNLSGPSGAITDNIYYTGQGDGSRLDFGEGHGHYFTTGTSPVNFNVVMQNAVCGPSNFYTYATWEISPKQ